jgi:hypothetical protein
MNTIIKSSKIKESDLSGSAYFQSLLEEGLMRRMLCEKDVEALWMQCMELLAYKSRRYTSGDSSSIRVEAAQNILQSCLYTIGVYLKTLAPDDAVCVLKKEKIHKLYEAGRKKLAIKLKTAKHLHTIVLGDMIKTINETYRETITRGIDGFFKRYDTEYGAHEIHITADYPLSNPIEDLTGIEFIIEYLNAVILENEICANFDPGSIHDTMLAYHGDYETLVINIFDQVLASAIGCVLSSSEPGALLIPKNRVMDLQSKWLLKTKREIENIVFAARIKLFDLFNIYDKDQKRYIERSLAQVSARIYLAIQTLTLDKVFVGLD